MFGLGAPELLIILVLVLLVFGGSKLPKLARSLGQAKNEFEAGTREGVRSDADDESAPAKNTKKD
jgi:sec-independent protein translocase protein TatA